MTRTFEYNDAKLCRVPLLIGLVGHSTSGKTMSGIRLGTGINSVVGGDLAVIDTEQKRATHYATKPDGSVWFKFKHVPLVAPFGSLDYLCAVQHCVKMGATTVIVDQISYEHDGEGGYLDTHDKELLKKTKTGFQKDPAAWKLPRKNRRDLKNGIATLGINAILIFRAEQKLDWKNKTDKDQPTDLGTQPVGHMGFIYELTAQFLLRPNSGGVPSWDSPIPAERDLIKQPAQFRELFERMKGKPLSEEYGAAMANWAQGTLSPVDTALADIAQAKTLLALTAAHSRVNANKTKLSDADKKRIGKALADRKVEIESMPPEEPPADWEPSE